MIINMLAIYGDGLVSAARVGLIPSEEFIWFKCIACRCMYDSDEMTSTDSTFMMLSHQKVVLNCSTIDPYPAQHLNYFFIIDMFRIVNYELE